MIHMMPLYPASCRPEDMLLAQEMMREKYQFSDVQVRGYYPLPAQRMATRDYRRHAAR